MQNEPGIRTLDNNLKIVSVEEYIYNYSTIANYT